MKKWFVVDVVDGSMYEDEMKATTREEAIDEARAIWNALSEYDKRRRDDFYCGLMDVDDDGACDLDSMEQYICNEELCRTWFAVMENEDDGWDWGSYDYKEAVATLKEQGYGLIAVILEGRCENFCIEEISYEEAMKSHGAYPM